MNFNIDLFERVPVVGIMRHFEKNVIRKILPIYEKVGFTTVEVTLNTKNAPELIKEFSIRHPNLNIGAGTVCNIKDLDTATNAGASFIVSPIFSEELIKECIEREIAVFPGALTPTEIYNAHILGATAIKVFPATNLGAKYIQDILAPLDNIKLIAVGGVSIDNIKSFFNNGCYGVGMGGALFPRKIIKEFSKEKLKKHFQSIFNEIIY